MRWSNKNKELIKQVIEKYRWMLKKKSRSRKFFDNFEDCPFCEDYHHYVYSIGVLPCLDNCPNVIITDLLDCQDIGNSYTCNCIKNAKYIELKLNRDCLITRTTSNIEKRLQFWEDALALTKKEFVRKYKKVLDKV